MQECYLLGEYLAQSGYCLESAESARQMVRSSNSNALRPVQVLVWALVWVEELPCWNEMHENYGYCCDCCEMNENYAKNGLLILNYENDENYGNDGKNEICDQHKHPASLKYP